MKCLARQHSDQMICHQCGLVWDVNDPEPPVCGREVGQGLSGACMRLGEVVRVVWDDLDDEKRLLTIRERKHPRHKVDQTIPLLGQAFDIASRQPRLRKEIFPYNADSISAAFHRAVVLAGIEDLRHEGISRLFERGLSIERVAMVSGHQDWAMLRRYTHLKPESLHEEEDLIGG